MALTIGKGASMTYEGAKRSLLFVGSSRNLNIVTSLRGILRGFPPLYRVAELIMDNWGLILQLKSFILVGEWSTLYTKIFCFLQPEIIVSQKRPVVYLAQNLGRV